MSARRKSRSSHNDQPRKRHRPTSGRLCGSDDGQHNGDLTLACPFYKAFPTDFTRCLFRYHLTSTSFVVQHIHRCHNRPLRCPICHETFDCGEELDEHIRQRTCRSTSCDRGCSGSGREGLDEHQMVELRKRTSRRGLTEAQRWYIIWDFIFPDSPRPDSPYIRSPQDEILGITRQAIERVFPGGNSPEVLSLMDWSIVSSAFGRASPYAGSSNQTSTSSQPSDESDGVSTSGLLIPKILGSPQCDSQSDLLQYPWWDSLGDLPELQSVGLQFDTPDVDLMDRLLTMHVDKPLTVRTDGVFIPEPDSLSVQKWDQPQSRGENMRLHTRSPGFAAPLDV